MNYSPEGLNDPNNNTSINNGGKVLEASAFTSYAERVEALYAICKDANLSEECADRLIHTGFLMAPASTKYHGNYGGGLFDHSYGVAIALSYMTQRFGLEWSNPKAPLRIGLFHDLCKIDQYTLDPYSGSYVYNSNRLLTEHGLKSVILAQQLPGVDLTEEEVACIAYHMGAFVDSKQWSAYTNAIHMYPNVLWAHTADCYAAHVMEVE